MTMDEPRKGFVYYRGFFESLKKLPDDEHFLMYKKVCEYALYGVEPLIEDVRLRIVFDLMREQIDANQKRYENGKKGGAPRGNRNAQKSQEQPKSTENNQNQPKEKEKEKEKEKAKDKEKVKDTLTVQTPVGRSSPERKAGVTDKEAEEVFAKLWELYPSKKGKGRVSMTTKKRIAKIGLEKMSIAIKRYQEGLKADDWRKPQNGSTFFNTGYIDYLDENYEEAENGKGNWDIGVDEI